MLGESPSSPNQELPAPEIVGAEIIPQPEPKFEYQLLTGHYRSDGTYKTTEQLQTEYIRLTDELVHKITDGVDVIDPATDKVEHEKVDYVVWLDKSARPVSWLMHDLWPFLAADSEGNIPPEPASRFVNIDRNQWTSSVDPQGQGVTNVADISPTIIRSLRSIFLVNHQDRKQGLTEQIDNAPTQFDGKTVLIVDELVSSGRTLAYAQDFFKRAFPEAKIAGTHWMGKATTKNQGLAVGNADQPVWYSDETDLGRGVANRNIDLSLTRGNDKKDYANAQRLGAWFLSVRLATPDPLSNRLRSELHQLAEDAKAGKVFIEPSLFRDEEDYDERALRLNDLTSLPKYIAAKRALSARQ